MLPRVAHIKPLRNRPGRTSACHPGCPDKTSTNSPGANLDMLPRIVPEQTSYGIVRSKPPRATPDRPDTTFTKSSGARLHMLTCIVNIKPLRNRPDKLSSCYPGSPKYNLYEIVRSRHPHATLDRHQKISTKPSEPNLHMLPVIARIKPCRTRPEQSST